MASWLDVDDPSEAWDALDPVINCLAGYGMTTEKPAKEIHGGPKGLDEVLLIIEHFIKMFNMVTGKPHLPQ